MQIFEVETTKIANRKKAGREGKGLRLLKIFFLIEKA